MGLGRGKNVETKSVNGDRFGEFSVFICSSRNLKRGAIRRAMRAPSVSNFLCDPKGGVEKQLRTAVASPHVREMTQLPVQGADEKGKKVEFN